MATHAQVPSDMLPRRYQEEIFVQAQQRNIIAALDAGSGKTFISILLIKWIASQTISQNKVIIFLVPKVTLVEQQGDFIARQTTLRVIKLHGVLDIDLADRSGWRQKFKLHDVFVMTAQIFLNLLTHSHWSIDKVSLIIFDECHHARKNHPYNGIMRLYRLAQPHQRPKVFGMTASPIWNTKDPISTLAALERELDAQVIGIRTYVEELARYSPKPVEIMKEYDFPPEEYGYPTPLLWTYLNIFDLWSDVDIPWGNIETRYQVTLNNLGPYCAELYLYSDMRPRITQLINDSYSLDSGVDMDADSAHEPLAPTKHLPADLYEIENILHGFRPYFSHDSDYNALPISIPLAWCSPKVRTLVDILLANYSPTFQGIVFVEQRQIAGCLARILPHIPELKNQIRCAELVGQGVNSEGVSKRMGLNNQNDAIKLFRQGRINLLIATSVAEEGLDFPACDLVVRFDPLQHIVGYVQSRGRARNKASTFIVMIQRNDWAHLARYKSFTESESELKYIYQSRQVRNPKRDDNENNDDEAGPRDIAEREQFIVASTGAILTYDNSINLLNYLCSLIPRDSFTPIHAPKYTGDFEATVKLPASIPLSKKHLIYKGPLKRSKREAKRAVAFLAVKSLHALDIFDDCFLPVPSSRANKDADGRPFSDVSKIPNTMDVLVRDPWTTTSKLWLHPIIVSGRCVAGLITGTELPLVQLTCDDSIVEIKSGKKVIFDEDEELEQRKMMHEFTKVAIWYFVTRRPFSSPLTLFIVPVISNYSPDFRAIERLVNNPMGSFDWSMICEDDYNHLVIMNRNEIGRTLLLRNIRNDLSPMSTPLPGSREAEYPTYYHYFIQKWKRKNDVVRVPTDGPLIEAFALPQYASGEYLLNPKSVGGCGVAYTPLNSVLVPQGCCRWVDISEGVRRAFQILPQLCHRITDVYRVQRARIELGLPAINNDLLVEALTLPTAVAGYNNQRMETLGDAVLKLATTVHMFNKYPGRHEGQLSALRQINISNRSLLSRAKDINLEQFLISEIQGLQNWRYTCAELPDETKGNTNMQCHKKRYARRQFPRRSLQDCMESTLGAAFLSGGVHMALRAGGALGLAFGGPLPWSVRYSRSPEYSPAPVLFDSLQESLGYTFHDSNLLLEAVTHPSFALSSEASSYQRLEFLGDALLDLVIVKYLYDKFPGASSHHLTWPKTRATCAPALAWVAAKRLSLHNIILINNIELSASISQHVPILLTASGEDIVQKGWKYDPPKAMSDVFESVMGAILIDSAYDYDKASAVVEFVMEDVLAALSPTIPLDPISKLVQWTAELGCRKTIFQKLQSQPEVNRKDVIAVVVHDVVIVKIIAKSLAVAKALAAERALEVLGNRKAEKSLSRLCVCGKAEINLSPLAVEDELPRGNMNDREIVVDESVTGLLEMEDEEITCCWRRC